MKLELERLVKHSFKHDERNSLKNIIYDNMKELYGGTNTIINAFEKKIFRYFDSDSDSDSDATKLKQNFEETVGERAKLKRQKSDELNEMITEKENIINKELLKRQFGFQNLYNMQNVLSKTQGTPSNRELIKAIKSGLIDLSREIKEMSQDEIEIEKSCEIIDVLEEILKYNNREQGGHRLKILTPQQMLSRLPSSLAQLKAGNNYEKLKNEIIQLLYSLYRSKKLSKKIYENLIKAI